MPSRERTTAIVALLVWLFVAAVYMITLAPTVPFWDAGEFIACSYILGIPHPPGTPLYVLLGRVVTLIPWATVAQRINAMSALPSALTVALTYLCGVKLIRLTQGGERTRQSEVIAHVGAATGALLLAFSDNFWENSIEAEVYSLASLAQILVFWLGLRWWEEHEEHPTAGPLLLCVYVMWLSVGLHLGVGMMGLPLILLVWLVDRRVAVVFAMPFLTVLLVTMGLERLAGGVLLLSTITFVIYAAQRKLKGWVVGLAAIPAAIGLYVAFGDADFNPTTALLAAAAVIGPMIMLARKSSEGKILALALFLMVVGYSTHAYLPIRAAQHPAINEGNPSNWANFRDLLERKQYGQMNMFERRAPWSVQLGKEFWRYFSRQWPLFHSDRLYSAILPLLLGVLGAIWHFRREKISFLYLGCFFGLSTAGLIVFLNFSDHEVRDRDYFFTSGYHAYALWIGMGVAWVIQWVRDSFAEGAARRWATVGTACLLGAQPLLLLANLWFTHDRRGNYVARDYAYNMLAPLAPHSFMYTNGDNDTFPLWYMQQVENFRKDVRIANLSLLNTDWYIQQLRDEEPRVPIRLDDATVKALGMGAIRDADGRIVYTSDFMVHHILDQARNDGGWKNQPYFAVTVPEHFGYEKTFTLEGLVYRVNRDTLHESIDVERTRNALYHLFKYRGLFKADGSWDSTVYKDENASTLSRNYAAAHIQLAYWYRRHGQLDAAIAEMERVGRMFPDFVEVMAPLGGFYMDQGDTEKAVQLFQRLSVADPRNPEVYYFLGATQAARGRVEEAIKSFDAAIQLDPQYPNPYFAAFYALSDAGQRARALRYVERWVEMHPDDARARAMLDAERGVSRPPDSGRPLVSRPPIPSLP
jgi:tetratricopeptide (TPR) repeat protein